MQYGNADMTGKSGSDSKFKKILKIQGGDRGVQTHNQFRIFPPMRDQALTGRWFAWEAVHWGYFGASSKDPTKAYPRSFLCPKKENWRTKQVEVSCAECDLIDELAAERKNLDPTEGKDKKTRDISKLTAGQQERLRILELFLDGGEKGEGRHERRLRIRLNAYSKKEGVAGLLLVSSSVFYQIKAKNEKEAVTNPGIIDKWMAKGINGIDPSQGMYVDIIRTGNGSGRGQGNDRDRVEAVMEAVNMPGVGMVERLLQAPIEERGPIDLAAEQLYDLLDNSHTSTPTSEQIDILVGLWRAGQHSPEAVDALLDGAKAPARGPNVQVPTSFRQEEEGDPEAAFQPQPVAAVTPAPLPATPPVVPTASAPSALPPTQSPPPAAPPALPENTAPKAPNPGVTKFLADLKAKREAEAAKSGGTQAK